MICKFCQFEKTSIQAHIIAKCILKPLLSKNGPLQLISKDVSKNSKKFWTGVYDSDILCMSCDNKFSPWEEYTSKFLSGLSKRGYAPGAFKYYQVKEFDYTKLKLCLLATLWKMSVTKRLEYAHVNLGEKYENEIRTLLDSGNPGTPDMFSIILLQFSDYVGTHSAIGTHIQKWQNSTFYHLGVPNFVATIKVGKESSRHIVQNAIFRPDGPLVIGLRSHTLGGDWAATFQKISRKNQKRVEKLR